MTLPGRFPRSPLDAWIAKRLGLGLADLSDAAVRARQLQALGRCLSRAARSSLFYQRRLTVLRPGFPACPADLERLPLLLPEDLVGQAERLLCVSRDAVERVVTLRTSGTTGPAKRLFFTPADLDATREFFGVGMSTLVGGGDVVLVLLPGRSENGVADLLARALPDIGARAVLASGDWPPGRMAAVLHDAGASCLVAAPSQLERLLEDFDFGRLAPGRVRTVLSSSEPLPGDLRLEVETGWDCRVFDHWGMTETGYGGGVECAARSGYHLREADLLVEIVDPLTGRGLPDGEVGEIVVSTLTGRGQPLVRYRTGDAARMLPGPCPCGSPLRRLGPILGRFDRTTGRPRLTRPEKGRERT